MQVVRSIQSRMGHSLAQIAVNTATSRLFQVPEEVLEVVDPACKTRRSLNANYVKLKKRNNIHPHFQAEPFFQ